MKRSTAITATVENGVVRLPGDESLSKETEADVDPVALADAESQIRSSF